MSVEKLRRLHLSRRVARLTPAGGLGFHGSSSLVRRSIDQNGLDPSLFANRQLYIFYNCFESTDRPRQLANILYETACIAVNRSKCTTYGPGENLPLLGVFVDPELRGIRSLAHSSQVRIIPTVPREHILGLYLIPKKQYRYDGNRGPSVTVDFVNEVLEDLSRKLSQ